jgi:hypothetical protein
VSICDIATADMGGSSQQLSFVINSNNNNNNNKYVEVDVNGETVVKLNNNVINDSYQNCYPDWKINNVDNNNNNSTKNINDIDYNEVYAKSFKGLGLIDAMTKVLLESYREIDLDRELDRELDKFSDIVNPFKLKPHPCLPYGSISISSEINEIFDGNNHTLYGSGEIEKCIELINKILIDKIDNKECIKVSRPKLIIGILFPIIFIYLFIYLTTIIKA